MGKNLFIAGGSGLLGLNWAYERREFDNVFISIHNREIIVENTTSVNLNALDRDSIEYALKDNDIDLVINTIGLTNVEECERWPSKAYDLNVLTAKNLADITYQLGVKMVHISTDHLYDGDASYSSEGDCAKPINNYSKTKYFADLIVSYCNPDALIIRSNFFGWGPTHKPSFSDNILSALVKKRDFKLFNDVYFTPVSMKYLIQTVHRLLDLDYTGIINISSGERLSKYEFGLLLYKCFGFDNNNIESISIDDLDLVQRPKDMSMSNSRLKELQGFEPRSLLEQIIELRASKNPFNF